MTDAEFRLWLARDNEQRCVLVELDYIKEDDNSPPGPTVDTIYLSDRKYFDDVTDFAYIDVVRAAPQYARSLSGDRLGTYNSTVGTLELDNADGGLDFLLNLACDGSSIRFYYGGQQWLRADFKLIFSAITSKVSAPSFDRISVTLKDTGLLLNKSIGGLSTVGGTGPNADRARPVNFGYIHNLEPLVIDETIDGGKYAHSDSGTNTAAVEVRDRGVSVGFTDDADGTFRLTVPPTEAGPITCDVLAEPVGDDNVRISDAMDHLIGERGGLTALSLYAGAGPTFTPGDDDDYLVGISLPEARNVIDLLADMGDSGNLFWAIKRTGEFTFGRLRLNDIADLIADSPPAIEAITILEDDIDQGTFRLEHAPTQYYKFQAYMSRNWKKQTEFATSLSPDEQAVYSRPGLYLLQPDSVGTDYLSAPELYHKTLTISPVIDTLLSEVFSAFDLDSLAQWMTTRRAMLLPWIELPAFTCGIDFYQLELGDPVLLIVPRFGEDAGVLFQVISITLRLTDAKIDLRLARRNIIQEVPDRWLRVESAVDDSQQEYVATPHPSDWGPQPPIGGIGDGGGSGIDGWWPYPAMKAATATGGELNLTLLGLYDHSAGSAKGSILANGLNVAVLSLTDGTPKFNGTIVSGHSTYPSPASATVDGVPIPGSVSASHILTFVFISELSNIIDISFDASQYNPNAGSVTATMAVEVKVHDDTASTTPVDWFPDGAGGGMTGGGVVILDPFSLNGTMTDPLTSGTFQCETPLLIPGHTYTASIIISVTNA